MSFPVPTKYLLNDNQDGKEIEMLPDPGCFSKENIEKFMNAWIRGDITGNIRISEVPSRQFALTGSKFNNIFFTGRGNITSENAFNRMSTNGYSFVAPFVNLTMPTVHQ